MAPRFLVFVLTAALAMPVHAQDVAAPGAPADVDSLEALCRTVSDAQLSGDRSLDGKCIGGTGLLLSQVQKATPDALEATVTDVTTRLAILVQEDELCTPLDTEIAQAIRLASTYSKDAEQVERIIEIAETLEACELGGTQAIDDPARAAIASDVGA